MASEPREQHPDPVDRLRHALWGVVDPPTQSVAAHLSGCDSCRREQELHQRVSARLHAVEAGAPPPGLTTSLLAELASEEPDPYEVRWTPATTVVASGTGVRGGAVAELQVIWQRGDLHLDACVARAEDPRARTVNGQLMRTDGTAVPAVRFALFVDLRPADVTVSDQNGEFDFGPHRGTRLGLRFDVGREAHFVEIARASSSTSLPAAVESPAE